MKKKNKKKGNSLIQKLLIFLVILVVAIVLFLQRRYFLFFSVLAISFISFIFFLTVKSFDKEKSLFSKRKAILIMIIFVCFLIYVLRLIKIQFFDVEKYTNLMNKQLLSTDKEIGQRGIIYDSNGKKMAFNKRLYTLIVDPSLLNDDKVRDNLLKDITAIKESGIIELNPNVEEEIKDLAEKNIRYKVLLKNIDDEKKEKIDALLTELHKETNGKKKKYRTHLIFEKLIDRVYFQKKEYEKLIGIYGMTENSNSQKIGVSGLEKGYEKYLVERRRAISKLYGLNKKNTLALSKDVLYLNLDGKDLHLTINTNLNYILNEEIKTQFEATNAYEAYGVIMDPNSGKILALSAFSKDTNLLRNNLFQSQYEPGSIFKPLIVAAAMNENFITPESKFDVGDGRIVRFKRTIRESSRSTRGVITAREVIMKSSNVGMVLISDYFSNELFEKYLKDFGLYNKTGVDFPNELKPYTLPYDKWDGLKKNNMAFGQGVVVTPIQMITAFSAVVNGGILYKPYIVDNITDSDGDVIMRNIPTKVRRVVSEDVSKKMRSILEDTVANGTGRRAKVEGYAVGGKTGTAQLSGGKTGYLKQEYLSSFIGFFPADDPKYVVMAMFMRPQSEVMANKFGGVVAAPVVGNVIGRIIKQEENFGKNISKINFSKENKLSNTRDIIAVSYEDVMPDLEGMSPQEVLALFKDTNIDIEVVGIGLVKEQLPKKGESLDNIRKIKIILE